MRGSRSVSALMNKPNRTIESNGEFIVKQGGLSNGYESGGGDERRTRATTAPSSSTTCSAFRRNQLDELSRIQAAFQKHNLTFDTNSFERYASINFKIEIKFDFDLIYVLELCLYRKINH